jgi:hypothetical protein
MPELPPCAANGNTLVEVDSGFYWLIAAGVDPSSVLTPEQIECHMAAAEAVNAAAEAQFASEGKYVHWRSGPVWNDFTSNAVQDWYKAEPLTNPGIDCDPDLWNAAFEPAPAWRWRGTSGKGLVTYYCLGDSPVDPPIDPPPDDGPTDCGDWSVALQRPITIERNTPYWIDFVITGIPPEVVEEPEITILFDGESTIVDPDTVSGILEIDLPGRQVRVVLTDGATHEFSVTVVYPSCSSTLKFDSEVLQAPIDPPAECEPEFTDLSARVCEPGNYKVVLTICDTDHTSNTVTIDEAGEVLPQLPVIIRHPETQEIYIGDSAALTVIALYATDYQWQISNGAAWVDIPGETQPQIEFDPTRFQDSGFYRVVVSNAAGSVISNVAILTVREIVDCSTYLVLRCETDSTCHGVHLSRVGDGDDDIDFVLDWVSSTSICTDPVVIDSEDGLTAWELYMEKTGPGSEPEDYTIRWRAATSPFIGERRLFVEDINRCYRVVMTKIGAGTGESDFILDWKKL